MMMTDDLRGFAPDPVAEEEAGCRLDKWLAGRLPDLSRTRIRALIEAGQVTAGDLTITDPAQRVKPGQVVRLVLPEEVPAGIEPQAMDLVVVYEDEDLIVIDKPAGLVVHPAPGNPDRTLVNALLAHCGESLLGIGGVRRPGIVHRLDKDTSGLMVAAKTEVAHHGLSAQFAAHTLARAYRALVWGCPEPRQGEIEGAIGRNPHDRKSMALVGRGGKPALTRYRVLSVYAQGALSLIECRLATGRTHQIRVHMTSRGHPLVGDSLYGRGRGRRLGALPAAARPVVGDFPRQALHATLLGFRHPTKGLDLCFESLIPTDISGLLEFLDRL